MHQDPNCVCVCELPPSLQESIFPTPWHAKTYVGTNILVASPPSSFPFYLVNPLFKFIIMIGEIMCENVCLCVWMLWLGCSLPNVRLPLRVYLPSPPPTLSVIQRLCVCQCLSWGMWPMSWIVLALEVSHSPPSELCLSTSLTPLRRWVIGSPELAEKQVQSKGRH